MCAVFPFSSAILRQRQQFRLGFDVETVDSLVESQRDLAIGLADAGKSDAVCGNAGGARASEFAFRHDVHVGALSGERAYHRLIGVGLHRVAYARVETAEGAPEDVVVPLDGRRRIAVEGRLDRVGESRQVDVLGMEHAVAIIEVAHITGAGDRG